MAAPVDPSTYKEALIFLGTAGVVIPIFRKLGMSSILGFLIVGALIGPHMLGGLAEAYPWLTKFVFTNRANSRNSRNSASSSSCS